MTHLGPEAAAPFTEKEIARFRGSDESCVRPVPRHIGLPRFKLHGQEADHRYAYKDHAGNVLGYVLRWNARTGAGKEMRPATFWEYPSGKRAWQARTWPEPRPLFGLDLLAKHRDAIVLLCEGEKAAEAVELGPLADAFTWARHAVIGMTWPGGTNAIRCADFSSLTGRDIIVVPDNDEAGEKAADQLVDVLHQIKARKVRRWKPSQQMPAKWDIADPIPDGIAPEALVNSILSAPEIAAPPLLPFINIGAWADQPVPEQEWSTPGRFPLRQPALSGMAPSERARFYCS
jgi:hypothetical protein